MKGAIALDAGKLYFGDYGGKVHAIRRSNGTKVWETVARRGGALGIGAGNFYSSAAVEYGRVYIGSTNGSVYSLSSADGKLAWSRSTGGYVYASPAVGEVRGGGRPSTSAPTTAASTRSTRAPAGRAGCARWARRSPGAASIIGDLVFVSDLGRRATWALGARTGKTVWKTRARRVQPGDQRRPARSTSPPTRRCSRSTSGGAVRRSAQSRAARKRPRGRRQRRAARAKAARQRAAQRQRARAIARRERQLRYRFAPHGHRHSAQARLQAQLPPPPARLQGARQDDRACATTTATRTSARALSAGARSLGAHGDARRCRCSFASLMRTCRSGRSRPPAPRRRRPAGRRRGARACPRRRRRSPARRPPRRPRA